LDSPLHEESCKRKVFIRNVRAGKTRRCTSWTTNKGADMAVTKKWWFRPTMLAVGIVVVLLVLGQGRNIAPFVYTLF